jgi:hypothetical protein
MIIEFEDPKIRSITSELICGLNEDEIENAKKSIANAWYLGVEKANILNSFPLANSHSEVFKIKYFEEGTVRDVNIVFNADGI